MITISPALHTKTYNIYNNPASGLSKPMQSFKGNDTSDIVSQGDKALNENNFSKALEAYQQANKLNPDDINIYRKMAKANFGLKDYASAENNFSVYLEKKPEDVDCLIELGETQRQAGFYQKALSNFEKAHNIDKSNDLAQRSILETKNNILAIYSPERAKVEKMAYASNNLREALNMTVQYLTPAFMKDMQDVSISFGETAQMGGTSNIAQYENYKNAITISNSYIYAAPQVIAAYLTHESIHAKDKDPYTSIREEQDAYEVATKFWINHSNGVSDPEMDYAKDLYLKSPAALSSRVEEIYTLRDPSIAKTSPNHPPEKKFHFNTSKKKAASQSIKEYNVIA